MFFVGLVIGAIIGFCTMAFMVAASRDNNYHKLDWGVNMERLSGDFNRGYTRAIQDIEDTFVFVQEDLISHKKRFNFKLIIRLLELFLKHRENFRENRNGFIRWNTKLNNLEFFENPNEAD